MRLLQSLLRVRSFLSLSLLSGLALTLLATSGNSTAHAAERAECQCDSYRDLAGLAGLSSQIASIGLSSLSAPADERIQALRLRISSNQLIPANCRAQLLAELPKDRTELLVRTLVGDQSPNRSVDNGSGRLAEFYEELYTSEFRFDPCGNFQTGVSRRQPVLALESRSCADRNYGRYKRFWEQSPEEIAKRIPATLADGQSTADIGSEQIQLLRAYHQVLNAPNEEALLTLVRSKSDGLSNDQFLKLVAMLGNRLARNYDNGRARAGMSEPGAVSGSELLSAARTNSLLGDSGFAKEVGLKDPTNGVYERAGVCRDIAVFQAKILEARGFKNTFVVSWSTRRGLHSNVVTQNPDRSGEVVQFNYGTPATLVDRDGSAALFQGSEDATFNYRIADARGRSLADIPSEMGKFMSEAAGFNIRHFDPLTRTSSSMTSVRVGLGADRNFQLGAVTGADGTGARYIGATGGASWGQTSLTPGKVGLVLAGQLRPAESFGTAQRETGLVAFVQAEQHFLTRPLELGKSLTLTTDTSLNATGGVARVLGGEKDTVVPGGNLRINSEAQLHQTSSDGRYQGTYRAGLQLDPVAVSDVREAQAYRVLQPNLNLAYAQATGSYKLSSGLALIGDVTAAVSQLGARGKVEAGVATDQFAATGSLSGRLTDSSALVEESAIRRAGVNLFYRPVEPLNLGVTGEIPLEGQISENARLLGSLAVVF